MWSNLLELFRKLFRGDIQTTATQFEQNELFAACYNDACGINIEAMACDMLAGIVVNESSVSVVMPDEQSEPSKKVDLLNSLISDFFDNHAGKLTADCAGNGGMFIFPYFSDGEITQSIVPQSRVAINNTRNDKITSVSVLADSVSINTTKKYYRVAEYSLSKSGVFTLSQRAVTDTGVGVPLDTVEAWADITPEYSIAGVHQLPIAYAKCPKSNRNQVSPYGVPITYGAGKYLDAIKKIMTQFINEYGLKKCFIGVDERLLDGHDRLPPNGLYKQLMSDPQNKSFWEIFDPQIRDSSFIAGLGFLFEQLEKAIGVSRGFFSKPQSTAATATEIKREMYDTFVTQCNFRTMLENTLTDLAYAYSVWIENLHLAPQSDYKLKFDWSYSLIESSTETFDQLTRAQSLGAVSLAELRQFIFPSETIEQSQDAVEQIRRDNPALSQLIAEN